MLAGVPLPVGATAMMPMSGIVIRGDGPGQELRHI
jgi:hypothetical protein